MHWNLSQRWTEGRIGGNPFGLEGKIILRGKEIQNAAATRPKRRSGGNDEVWQIDAKCERISKIKSSHNGCGSGS